MSRERNLVTALREGAIRNFAKTTDDITRRWEIAISGLHFYCYSGKYRNTKVVSWSQLLDIEDLDAHFRRIEDEATNELRGRIRHDDIRESERYDSI